MVYGSKVQSYQIFKINSPSNPDDNTNVEYQAWGTWEGYNGIPQPIPGFTGTNNLWFKQLGSIGAGFDRPIWTTDYELAKQWNIPYSKTGVTIEEAKALDEANRLAREKAQFEAQQAMLTSNTAKWAGEKGAITPPSPGGGAITPPSPGGVTDANPLSNSTINIKGEKGMQGIVEIRPEGPLWHITYPVKKDVWYGIVGDVPATWVNGNVDGMAVVRGNDVFLDEGLSGGIGEINAKINDIEIISQTVGNTAQIRLQNKTAYQTSKTKTLFVAIAAVIALIAGALYFIFGRKKK